MGEDILLMDNSITESVEMKRKTYLVHYLKKDDFDWIDSRGIRGIGCCIIKQFGIIRMMIFQ